MHRLFTFYGVFFSFVVTSVVSARILGIVSTPSYSHQVVFHPLWQELSLRGHQVTVLTTHPLQNPLLTNLTEINLNSPESVWNKVNVNAMAEMKVREMFESGIQRGYDWIDEQLQHQEVQALIKNETEHFDLLIAENRFIAMIAFSERFKCPFILLTSYEASTLAYYGIGNPGHPVLNPDYLLPFSESLTFFERLLSTALVVVLQCVVPFWNTPSQELLVKKHFGDNYPPLNDILKNTSMLFVNTDPILHQVRPLVPAIVQIGGGIHLKDPQPLPKNLQKHLDDAVQGFIYFSLGSNVKSKQLSEEARNILLQTFAELPYMVLWKFEEDLPGKPSNVITSKWFPQQDILRHPNIKLFISQGGLQSTEEALYSYVPIIGMPFVGDQKSNVAKLVSKGLGVSVDYKTMDKTSFKNTILEVINNPTYRNRAKELAKLARDQPMTGLERAVWWTEYVLRHKGAKHLRSPALDLPVYQYYLLDVIGFCLLALLVLVYLAVMLVMVIFRLMKYFKTKKIKVQ